MELQKEFRNLIKQGKKTTEFRKVSKTEHYIDRETSIVEILGISTGRYKIPVYKPKNEYIRCSCQTTYHHASCNNDKKIGYMIINGYSIQSNIFNKYSNWDDYMKKTNITDQDFKIIFLTKPWETKWIKKYWEWLTEYFKNESEILVLNIESWEE